MSSISLLYYYLITYHIFHIHNSILEHSQASFIQYCSDSRIKPKIEQHTSLGIDSPVLHTCATTDFNTTMPSPNLVSHSVPIITLTLRAKRHSFCITRKKLPLKARLIFCYECSDMLHATVSSPPYLSKFTRLRAHAHKLTHQHKLADGSGRKGHVTG